jgi:hypothetical protein
MDGKTYQRLFAAFDNTLVDLILYEEASGCDEIERRIWTQILVSCKLFLLQFHNMRISHKTKLMI